MSAALSPRHREMKNHLLSQTDIQLKNSLTQIVFSFVFWCLAVGNYTEPPAEDKQQSHQNSDIEFDHINVNNIIQYKMYQSEQ